MVSITPVEAFWIAAHLRYTLPPAEFQLARERIATHAARATGMTIEGRAAARFACALLAPDGACSIHPFRPLGCRGWTSFDSAACDAALAAQRPGHEGPQDAALHAAAGAASEAVNLAARAAQAAPGDYEFHGALLRALDTPAGSERWAAGQDVFAGCWRVTSDRLRAG